MDIRPVSDSALIVRFADQPSFAASDRVLRFLQALRRERLGLKGIHPAYASVLVEFDPMRIDGEELRDRCTKLAADSTRDDLREGDHISIPVRYEGPDLVEVAELTGLSVEEVIRLHVGVEYRVAFLGFSPGFPYLLGLPPRLECARRSEPRVRVPAGSVAIAGRQAGVYPFDTPGGWRILGFTSKLLFDPTRSRPTLLQPGDRVTFVRESIPQAPKKALAEPAPTGDAFEILSPGPLTSVQDEGRTEFVHLGISRGGAADPLAYRTGNRLVGNRAEAAALEMTVKGVRVRFMKEAVIAITGGACSPRLDGRELEMWAAVSVMPGQVLEVGAIAGLRAYLCVRGGIEATRVLGSRSAHVSGDWGGRICAAGDRFSFAFDLEGYPVHRPTARWLERLYADISAPLRVTRGLQWEMFSPEAREKFFASEYRVSEDANRLGLRLRGERIAAPEEELLSEGVASGAVQIPPGGQPLVLFCEQCTTGGYAKLAQVIAADLWRLGQLSPGMPVRFREVSFEEAEAANLELGETLTRLGLGGEA